MNQTTNQIKYGLIKAVNIAKNQWKYWLEKNSIEMYSAHNERKSVVTERIIRILKTEMFKYMTSI